MDILQTLRDEIKNGSKSRYEIAKATGIDQAALCRIMQGGECKNRTIDKLCEYFGYELIKKKNKGR